MIVNKPRMPRQIPKIENPIMPKTIHRAVFFADSMRTFIINSFSFLIISPVLIVYEGYSMDRR